MIESTESLLPKSKSPHQPPLRAYVLGHYTESLAEMGRLLDTLGIERVGQMNAPLREIQSGTYFGTGKLEELRLMCDAHSPIDVVIFDVDLTPRQLQNVEQILKAQVLDRAGVILEIFSRRARTREAKTQVELARLQYVLPRLAGLWSHFERQRGGGVGNRGMGEKQIEVDRRLVKQRIQALKLRLKEIEKDRKVQRKSRDDLLKVALVGYTNAGKSTLLNALTRSQVLSEDKLFATLDATVRALSPDSHPPIVAVDTVGFIQNIPTSLIASFRSTLEEINEADLILHVVDASSDRAKEHFETTRKVLEEIGAHEKETLVVLNKVDLLKGSAAFQARLVYPGAFRVSALDPDLVEKLRAHILTHFQQRLETLDVVIPFESGRVQAQIREFSTVVQERILEKGIFYRIKIERKIAEKLNLARYAVA